MIIWFDRPVDTFTNGTGSRIDIDIPEGLESFGLDLRVDLFFPGIGGDQIDELLVFTAHVGDVDHISGGCERCEVGNRVLRHLDRAPLDLLDQGAARTELRAGNPAAALAWTERGLALEYVETNAAWVSDQAQAEAVLADPGRGGYLVAEGAGEMVGQLLYTPEWSDWRNGRFWWIQSVYVSVEHRRTGVYSALHEAIRNRALADPEGCGIRLYVEQENTRAQATYAHLGMIETHYRLYEEEF